MDPTIELVLFWSLCNIPWLIASWIRVWHYARYFQLEGYDNQRYSLWLSRNRLESRSELISCLLAIAIPIFACILLYLTRIPLTTTAIIIAIGSAVAAAVVLYLAPRDNAVKQKFARTQRAIR